MKSYTIIFVVLAVIVLLAACTDKSLNPIFYTLETERSLSDDRGIEDEAFVHELVRVTAVPEDRYFAAANKLFTRTLTGNWGSVSPPVAGALCNTIEAFSVDNDIYAGFFASDGTGLGLYRTDPDTIDWTASPIPDTDVQNVQIGLIKDISGTLYVVTAAWNGSAYDYYLYSSVDGDNYNLAANFDSVAQPIDAPITDIEVYGGEYWVIAGDRLYADTAGGLDDLLLQSGGPATTGSFGGLLVSGGNLYLSATDGQLWTYNGAWSAATDITIDGTDVRFTRFIDDTTGGDVLVGTQGTGYYELTGGVLANYERHPDYNISALYRGAVTSFFLDTGPDPDVLFACTYGAGLWRADWSGSEWIWVQE
jgi:hypothetical protein